jgi:hypothetical protein
LGTQVLRSVAEDETAENIVLLSTMDTLWQGSNNEMKRLTREVQTDETPK